MGLIIDETSLIKSRRCTPTICKFISQKIGINIKSCKQNISSIKFIDDKQKVNEIFKDNRVVKLFYEQHIKYNCFSENWGASKGKQYKDVCLVLNETTLELYKQSKLNVLAPQTKNKFYVACSRTENNLYFIPHNLIE